MAADATRENIVDLSKIDLPVQLEDRSFDGLGQVPELIKYLKDIRDNAVDYVVPGPKLDIRPDEKNKSWELWFEDSEGGIRVFKPTTFAQAQTIGKTPVPKKYHDEMLAKGKVELAARNLNEWLQGKQYNLQIRTVGDRYRAMVSDGFFAFDNLDLFSQVAHSMKAVNDARVAEQREPVTFRNAEVTETDMFVSLLDKDAQYNLGTPEHPDIYQTMTVIRNSEVGKSSMSIEPGFFRGLCMNFWTHQPALRKVHRGEKLDEGIFSEDTRQQARDLWRMEVRDVLGATIVDRRFFDRWAQDFRESKEVQIQDMRVAVHRVVDQFNFTEAEEQAIMDAMMVDKTVQPEDKDTAYALLQGMTSASQQFGTDRTYEVARIAGDVKKVMAVVAA